MTRANNNVLKTKEIATNFFDKFKDFSAFDFHAF